MEQIKSKIIIYVMFVVLLLLLFEDCRSFESPTFIDTFGNNEDFQKYFSEKEKSFEKLANPLDDSYISAYNIHHETPKKVLVKRSAQVANSPQIFKFSPEDAKEPDEVTKDLIRMHRARELKLLSNASTTSKRTKRSVQKSKIHFIKFEVSDAKEPDEATKELIQKSRARELRLQYKEEEKNITNYPLAKVTKKKRVNRGKRSVPRTQPQFIRFQLEDAKEPENGFKWHLKNREMRYGSINKELYHQSNASHNHNLDDSSTEESRRFFTYQEMPIKSKRASNVVPLEVKKIIDRMLKDNKAQAYYKYISTNSQIDESLRAQEEVKPVIEEAYVQKLIPVPVHVHSPIQQQAPVVDTYPITASKVNTNLQYYPVSAPLHYNHDVYQQPTTFYKVIPTVTQVVQNVPIIPSVEHQTGASFNSINSNDNYKHYPQTNQMVLDSPYRYGKHLHFYSALGHLPSYPIGNHIDGSSGGLNPKQHQVLVSKDNVSKDSYRIPTSDVQEFHELSSLIGKSPTDQIHGLAYMLAKEMQRTKGDKIKRPHDNTAPILFHPEESKNAASLPTPSENPKIQNDKPETITQSALGLTKREHAPILEHDPDVAYGIPLQQEQTVVVSKPPAPPTPTSFSVVKLLSPNYKGIDQIQKLPAVQNFHAGDNTELQYASKYTFGYRVQDFHSGNDFSHRENRDLDGVTRGQYHILLPDGRVQNVIYHADDTGYHADVSFKTADDAF